MLRVLNSVLNKKFDNFLALKQNKLKLKNVLDEKLKNSVIKILINFLIKH